MMKGENGMGETWKRVAKECQNDSIWTQINKIKKVFSRQVSIGSTRISNASVVNVADEEKQESCTGDNKYER